MHQAQVERLAWPGLAYPPTRSLALAWPGSRPGLRGLRLLTSEVVSRSMPPELSLRTSRSAAGSVRRIASSTCRASALTTMSSSKNRASPAKGSHRRHPQGATVTERSHDQPPTAVHSVVVVKD